MKKNYLSFLPRDFYRRFLLLKKTRNSVFYLLVFLFFVLHTVEISGQIDWGNATPPSSSEILKDLGDIGKIYKTTWSGPNTLQGSEQILHMAELNFFNTPTRDYELKIAYIYNDPYQLPNKVPVDPAECKEVCYYITCTRGEECNNGLQRFCEPVPGGQFDFVSHIAAKYGAVMATNGAFYDYFYNCVPGVKSYIKIDNHVFSKPNILNHRNEGALAFDFRGVTPKIDIFERSANTLEELDNGNLYHSTTQGHNIASYPNVMSGGHLNEKLTETDPISPYTVDVPSFCNGITYPWSGESQYTGDNDILKKRGTAWRNFACPTIPNTREVDKPLPPTAYGYKDFFKCSNLNDLQKRKQLTCIDYAKFDEEFGGTDGLAKRSRTFIAIKGQKLYWFVADGAVDCKKPNGQIVPMNQCAAGDTRVKGFTIGELDQFARDMGFDKMLNFDGGSSSAFYLNGKGILQFQYDPNALPSNKRVGPQAQRLLQSVLMLVPRQKNLDDVYKENRILAHAVIDNRDPNNKSFIDLSPAVDKIKNAVGVYGNFNAEHDKSHILYSVTKDENKQIKEGLIVGLYKIPEKIKEWIRNTPAASGHTGVDPSHFDTFKGILNRTFGFWAIRIHEGHLASLEYNLDSYWNETGLSGHVAERWDHDTWNNFFLAGGDYKYSCLTCINTPETKKQKFAVWFNTQYSSSTKNIFDWEGSYGEGSLHLNDPTNVTIGAAVINGEYITGNGVLKVQDYIFSKNFDNYYSYTSNDLTNGYVYGDPNKEVHYLAERNWNSKLYDEMHLNETNGVDDNTIFCFDERAGSKVAYAWYRGGRGGAFRHLKTFGTYVGNTYTASHDRKRRSTDGVVDNAEHIPRALYHIVNKQNGLKLESKHKPYNNQGTVYLENNEDTGLAGLIASVNHLVIGGETRTIPTVFGTTNKFLVETMGENRILISNAGLFTLKGSSNAVQTNLDFSPNDLENYWELEPGLTHNEFYIKHKYSGKYLTGGSAGANISLSDFNFSKSQQWSLEKTDDAEKVIIEDYYQFTRLSKAIPSSLTVENISDTDNQKWLIDYVGGGFYMLKPKTLDKVFTANLKTNQIYYASDPNYNTSLEDFGLSSKTQLFAIELTENDTKVNIHRYVMNKGMFRRANVWDDHQNGFNNISLGFYENSRKDYNIIYKEKSPDKLSPSHYEIGSLAHIDLVASHSGNQVLAQADDGSNSNHIWDFHDIGLGRYLILQPDASSYSNVNSNKWAPTTTYTDRKALEVIINEDGSSTLKYNGQCLTDNGTGQEYSFTNCSSGNNQKYMLYLNKHHEFITIDRGYYRIVNKNSYKSLRMNDNNVDQYEYFDDTNHNDQWLLEPLGHDEYLIRNRRYLFLLDVQRASRADDANILAWYMNRNPNQRWKLVPSSQEGFYQIKSVNSEKCLDVHNLSSENGANIKQLFCRQSGDPYLSAQLFAIEKVAEAVPVFPDITYQLETNHYVHAGEGKLLGQAPVSFNNDVQFSYGTYNGINKSDLFYTEYQGAGLYRISRSSNGKVMAIGGTAEYYDYTVVQKDKATTVVGNHQQLWSFETNFGGNENNSSEFDIVSAQYPDNALYLGSQYAKLYASDYYHYISDWKLVPKQEPSFDIYNRIYPQAHGGIVLAIPSYDLNQIVQAPPLYDDGAWSFDKLEDGYYRFVNKYRTDKVMSAGNQSTDDIKAVSWNANDNKQRWSIENISNGAPFYRIVNKATSLAMYWPRIAGMEYVQTKTWIEGDNKFKWKILKYEGSPLRAKIEAPSLKEEPEQFIVSPNLSQAKIEAPLKEEPEQFTVSPNPSQGEIDVNLSLFKNKNFKTLRFNFHDLSGKLIYGTTRKVDLERNPIIQFTDLTYKGFIILNIIGPDDKVLGSKNIIFR